MKQDHLRLCSLALEKLSAFLMEHFDIINVCMVDFISKNLFDKVLNCDVRNEMSWLTDEQIISFPENSLKFTQDPSETSSALEKLFYAINSHSLENLGVLSTLSQVVAPGEVSSAEILQHFDRVASDKKMHEVVILCDIISRLVSESKTDAVIDVGSGKGYLSHLLAATHSQLLVLGVEGSNQYSESAKQRRERLEKRWKGLLRRAQLRSDGLEPPTRGKHWKSKGLEDNVRANNSGKTDSSSNLAFVTQFVDKEMDLCDLISHNFNTSPNNWNIGLVGLHTCGNLASISFRTFIARTEAKFCCNVGCCYHLLDEGGQGTEANFPMSAVLKNKNFFLGRNPLMMAAQPRERSIVNKELPDKSLLWRSVLQVLLLKYYPDITTEKQQVGRLASKSTNFHDYVRKAFEKLSLQIELSDDEITSIYSSCEAQHGQHLNSFYQLRSLFAPVIEGLILLDRLTFLLEQDHVEEAHLTKVFDPVISPRCFAIIAKK